MNHNSNDPARFDGHDNPRPMGPSPWRAASCRRTSVSASNA